ncbi:hypothetical protein [Sphingobacterium sp. 1.A.4]|uniref:hypothetical protein n=1 Tax=Sphingobacterium sp. 1.A.4 TaxID=2044603 RepID=UPI000C0BD9F4|nr:hypothetical protein [Sphingobacterium sp. 1.A.4]
MISYKNIQFGQTDCTTPPEAGTGHFYQQQFQSPHNNLKVGLEPHWSTMKIDENYGPFRKQKIIEG